MKSRVNNQPITSLTQTEQTLFLIGEELKARRFNQSLRHVGFTENNFEPHLDALIIQLIGLDESDETFERYMKVMDSASRKIKDDGESIHKQRVRAYRLLLRERVV